MGVEVVDLKARVREALSDVEFAFANEGERDWDSVLLRATDVDVPYTRHMVEYQNAYMISQSRSHGDLSLLFYDQGQPVAVWPFSVTQKENVAACGSNEGPVLPPLFTDGLVERCRKRIVNACLRCVEECSLAIGAAAWRGVQALRSGGVDLWHRQIMEKGAKAGISHQLCVNLSLDIGEIKRNFRKSYRPLISKGHKLWKLEVHQSIGDGVFLEFRDLHARAAGKITRNSRTWDMQKAAINERNAFLVTARAADSRLVGAALFYLSRTEALYAVGAYDRDLFDQPIGHAIQASAIDHMKSLGLRWYVLGDRPYPSSGCSEKEFNIGRFKEGFATDFSLKIITDCPINQN